MTDHKRDDGDMEIKRKVLDMVDKWVALFVATTEPIESEYTTHTYGAPERATKDDRTLDPRWNGGFIYPNT